MYNQKKFIEILKKCQSNMSLNEFARLSNVDAGYLSRIINKKKSTPPSPRILEKISKASKGVTTYEELMEVCGYVNFVDSFFNDSVYQINDKIPLIHNIEFKDNKFIVDNFNHYIYSNFNLDSDKEYFAYEIRDDDSLLPMLGKDDIVIVCRQNTYENNYYFLICLDESLILIRKLVKDKEILQLQSINPYYPVINLTEEEMKTRNFQIIGKVIKAEITSMFK